MKKYILRSAYGLVVLALGVQGCKPTIDAPSPSAGSVDFSNYVAVGNSLTAGFSNGTTTNGGLYYDGQIHSYPSILAAAMQATGKGPASFLQPLFPVGSAGSGYAILNGIRNGVPSIGSVGPDLTQIETTSPLTFKDIDNGFDIHNLGVPGIRIRDIKVAGYGTNAGNPYFERMLPDADQYSTYLRYVARRRPTFFTNWLGNNDILGYASNGAVTSSETYITEKAVFESLYREMVDTLMRSASKGLLATIPNVTSAAYFTTVPPACIALTRQGQVDSLNFAYQNYNQGVALINSTRPAGAKLDSIKWRLGANLAIIRDTAKVYQDLYGIRPIRPGKDLILLPASYVLPLGQGSASGLADQFVLTEAELAYINQRTNEINDFIRGLATQKGLALFDAAAILEQVKAGTYFFDGVQITSSFISGGAFSLDGVHPTSRGYALIANEMMKAINAKYGTSLSPVNAVDYPAVTFPK